MTHTPLGTDLDVQQGTTWHDGKLYFFHPHFIEVLRIWPKPAAWRKDARGGWKHVMSGQFSYDAHVSSARGVQDVVEKAAQTGPVAVPVAMIWPTEAVGATPSSRQRAAVLSLQTSA